MKVVKKQKMATKISLLAALITITGLSLMWFITTKNAAATIDANLTNQMTDAVKTRAAIINDYVSSAEEFMIAFSLGEDVTNLLHDPENPELIAKAQKYTEDFAAVKGVFEGLYIATPETHIRTHNVPAVVGKITRPGDMLEPFQKNILSKTELTNLGIMASPGTGAMIISMYYPIFEDGKCIGYIGGAVFANALMDSLKELDIPGLPNSEYVFLNAETGLYLYHENEELINTETTDAGYQEIMQRIQSDHSTQLETYKYTDENGTGQFVVYQYLPDRGWIFMIRNSTDEVYAVLGIVNFMIGLVSALIAAFIVIFLVIMMSRVGKRLVKVEGAIGRLGQLELETEDGLERIYKRNDEIGNIARTTHVLCERLRLTVDDISRILGEMADGNIAVDVSKNESYYIGDFKMLSESLTTIREKLLKLIGNIARVSGSVANEAEHVSQSTVSLSHGFSTQEASVSRLNESVDAISMQIQSNTDSCAKAQRLADQAATYTSEANEKMMRLTEAMNNVASSSAEIEKIIRVIEDIAFQTNILALNAAVEAARAGAAGKGFAVVAEEVRSLASKSAAAAKNTADLINRSIQDVNIGMEATTQTAEIMKTIGECTVSIKGQMDGIAGASTEQSNMIVDVSKEIREISRVVQNNSDDVNQSVNTLQKLSEQAKELNILVGQFRTEK